MFLSSQDDLLRKDKRPSDSYDPLETLKGSKRMPQISQLRPSTSHNFKSLASMHSLEASGRLYSFNSEADGDPVKVKMTPRVAVRDKTPHRFQVVPLREISQRPIDGMNALALPNIRQNQTRLSAKGSYNVSSGPHSNPSRYIAGTSLSTRQPLIERDQNVESPNPSELHFENVTSTPKGLKSHRPSLKPFSNQAALLLLSTSLSTSSLSSLSVECHHQEVQTKSSPSLGALDQLAFPCSHLEDRTPGPARKQTTTLSENVYNGRSEHVSEGNLKPMIKYLETSGRPSSKRHAIYNQPVYIHFFDQTDIPELAEDSDKAIIGATGDFAALAGRRGLTFPQVPPVCGEKNNELFFDAEEKDPNFTDTSISVMRPMVPHQDTREIKRNTMTKPIRSLPPTFPPFRPLRCSRTGYIRSKSFSGEKAVYSSIVLELMSDIDKALEEWRWIT